MYNNSAKGSKNNKGIIQTAQGLVAGISKPFFYEYVKEDIMKQTAHGAMDIDAMVRGADVSVNDAGANNCQQHFLADNGEKSAVYSLKNA